MTHDSAQVPGARIRLDGHAHLYPSFPLLRYLRATLGNLQEGGHATPRMSTSALSLVVALFDGEQNRSTHPLRRLHRMDQESDSDVAAVLAQGWEVRTTDEACSLHVIPPRARLGPHRKATDSIPPTALTFLAGRQLRTAEGFEVLAFPCLDPLPHDRPLTETVERVLQAGALPIIPWGLGKWWLRRGAKLAELLTSDLGAKVLLGDSGNRPRRGSAPHALRLARERGIPVIAGSDPLPLPHQVDRAGSYGSSLQGSLDARRPAEGLRTLLGGLAASPPTFGRRVSLTACLAANIQLRLPTSGRS